ncbi:hypothetical protein ACRAQ6_13635 [Erythrobacter sp. HA6-11]
MRLLVLFLATTSGLLASGVQAAESDAPEGTQAQSPDCSRLQDDSNLFTKNKCASLEALLVEMQAKKAALNAAKKKALDNCLFEARSVQRDPYIRGDAASHFFALLDANSDEELKGKQAKLLCQDRVEPQNIPEKKTNSSDAGGSAQATTEQGTMLEEQDPSDVKFRRALKAYQKARKQSDEYEETWESAKSAFGRWFAVNLSSQSKTGVKSVKASVPGRDVLTTGNGADPEACRLVNSDGTSALFARPDHCIGEIFRAANPGYRAKDGQPPDRPSRWNLEQNLTTAQSGANAAITLNRTLGFRGTKFASRNPDKDQLSRRTRTVSFSGGIEAKLEDGIANIVGGNSDDANFLSLDRLNNDVVLRFALGYNFFRKETFREFEERRDEFLKKARNKCIQEASRDSPQIVTDCYDLGLLNWLYREKKGAYVHADLVGEFEQLVSRSSEDEIPQFGFGATSSMGLANQDYHLFSDDDRNLDTSLVDEIFFTKPSGSNQFRQINQRLAYTAGVYSYWNWKFERFPLFAAATLRVDAQTKRELESLEGKSTEICRADLGNISTDGIFDASEQCSSTVIFRPRMQTSYIPKIELRLRTKKGSILPAIGLAPSYQREFRNGRKDKTRWELPVFLTSKDGKLNGGLGLAFTKDKELSSNKQATTLFIFLGRKFSLDGSK